MCYHLGGGLVMGQHNLYDILRMEQIGYRAAQDQFAATQNAHAIAKGFYLGQIV